MLRFLWASCTPVSPFLATHFQPSLVVDRKSLLALGQWFSALNVHQCHRGSWLKPHALECLGWGLRNNSSRKFSGDTAVTGPGLYLKNLSFGENCFMVTSIHRPKMLFLHMTSYSEFVLCTFCLLTDYRIALSSSSFSHSPSPFTVSLLSGRDAIPLPQPLQFTPVLHPWLTYQEGITKRMVLADSVSTGSHRILRSMLRHQERCEETRHL